MRASSESYVLLAGGLAVPTAPVLLAFDLESRGFRLERIGNDILIQPFSRLTSDDLEAVVRWKQHLLALLDYRAPGVQ